MYIKLYIYISILYIYIYIYIYAYIYVYVSLTHMHDLEKDGGLREVATEAVTPDQVHLYTQRGGFL